MKVRIETLGANLQNLSGNEHRVGPIVNRAAAIFAEGLHQRLRANRKGGVSTNIDSLTATPLDLNVGRMANQQVAQQIASAWLQTIALKLKL